VAEVAERTCIHHWLLTDREEEVIRGRCKQCGAERAFPASVEEAEGHHGWNQRRLDGRQGFDSLPGGEAAW